MIQSLFFIATKIDSVVDENEKLKQTLAEAEKKWSDIRDASKDLLSRFTTELKDTLDPPKTKKKQVQVQVEGETAETGTTLDTKVVKPKTSKKKVEEGEAVVVVK